MSDNNPNQKAHQNLSHIARLLASQADYQPPRDLKVSVAQLDAAMVGMEIEERLLVKSELRRTGILVG